MTKRKLSVAELNAHLDEQLGALQRSALLFDEGYFVEARRMAVTLRVLLHSAKYPSLLKRLGRDGMSFVDTAFPHNPEKLMPSHGLVSLRFGVNEKSYVARLDSDHSFTQKPFQEWWNAIVFSDLAKRHGLVLKKWTRPSTDLGILIGGIYGPQKTFIRLQA